MGNVCFTPICSPLSRQDWYDIHERATKYTTTERLTKHLMKKARTPHMRLLYRMPHWGRRVPANIGPVIPFVRKGLLDCAPGITYVLPMKSFLGKTMASEFLIAELRGRNSLYVRATGNKNIARGLKSTLNTTVDSDDLPQCLVSALGETGVGRDPKNPSLLIIDEVNTANADNKAFIEDLFLLINRDSGLTCVIVTNNEEVANALIALNLGKIQPFPGSAKDDWTPPNRPEWLPNVQWTRDELKELIRHLFESQLKDPVENVFTEQFPADGETPGAVRSMVALKIQKGEIN